MRRPSAARSGRLRPFEEVYAIAQGVKPWFAEATETAGVARLHFHDLRYTGNMLAAESASLRELMARMGHSSTRAALIYQHASREREVAIAAVISARVAADRPAANGHAAGTAAWKRTTASKAPETAKAPLTCGRGAWSG